jgi:hypothetical protein
MRLPTRIMSNDCLRCGLISFIILWSGEFKFVRVLETMTLLVRFTREQS